MSPGRRVLTGFVLLSVLFGGLLAPQQTHAAPQIDSAQLSVAQIAALDAYTTAQTATSQPACFTETNQCIQGIFLDYWVNHGGLTVNGFPLSGEFVQRLEDGRDYTVQYFERSRLEYHPENAPQFQVLLGAFGRKFRRQEPTVPPTNEAGSRYFPETGHNVPQGMALFWDKVGGLPQCGYPLAEVEQQKLENGQKYYVQYFERCRVEYHPENARDDQKFLLGQFGRQVLNNTLPELLSLETVNAWCHGQCTGRLGYADFERVVTLTAQNDPKNCHPMDIPAYFTYDGWDGQQKIQGEGPKHLDKVCDAGFRHS